MNQINSPHPPFGVFVLLLCFLLVTVVCAGIVALSWIKRGERGVWDARQLAWLAGGAGIILAISYVSISWITALIALIIIVISVLPSFRRQFTSRPLVRMFYVLALLAIVFLLGSSKIFHWPVELPVVVGRLIVASGITSSQVQVSFVGNKQLRLTDLPHEVWSFSKGSLSPKDFKSSQMRLSLEDSQLLLDTPNSDDIVVLRFRELDLDNSTIITQGQRVLLVGDSIRSNGGIILSFPSPNLNLLQSAPGTKGIDGSSGGEVWLEVDKIDLSGVRDERLQIYLFGQRGGPGGNGNPGVPGGNGAPGANAADGFFNCSHGGTNGYPGANGSQGGPGGNGGRGGDGGVLKIFGKNREGLLSSIDFHSVGGDGGPGGKGGVGGPGGRGGLGGSGSAFCSGGRSGLDGAQGLGGPDGQTGPSGQPHPQPVLLNEPE